MRITRGIIWCKIKVERQVDQLIKVIKDENLKLGDCVRKLRKGNNEEA